MKDRLMELHKRAFEHLLETEQEFSHENYADYLLANGVIVPPCKVGDTVFLCGEVCDEEGKEKFAISEGVVVIFSLQEEGLWAYVRYKSGLTYWHIVEEDFGKTVFLTREEAEAALAEREGKG